MNNQIPFDYDPNAKCDLLDKTLDKVCCYDPQIRTLLEEMIGYSLYRKNSMQSCFILTGEGSNGKSTILNLIKRLLGKANYTSLDLRELEDTFKPAELYQKLANIGDYNYNNSIGQVLTSIDDANLKQMQTIGDFNRGTNQYNDLS